MHEIANCHLTSVYISTPVLRIRLAGGLETIFFFQQYILLLAYIHSVKTVLAVLSVHSSLD